MENTPEPTKAEIEAAWKFVRSGAVLVATIADEELPEIHSLMSRYWDRPMDFADATLVYLARRESQPTILTVDHADFETYRIAGRRRFRVGRRGEEQGARQRAGGRDHAGGEDFSDERHGFPNPLEARPRATLVCYWSYSSDTCGIYSTVTDRTAYGYQSLQSGDRDVFATPK